MIELIGPNPSLALERIHCRSELCQLRSVKSLPANTPKITSSACDSLICLACLPITNTNSPSKCTLFASSGRAIVSPEAINDEGNLRNNGGGAFDGDEIWLLKFIPTANTFCGVVGSNNLTSANAIGTPLAVN